MEILRDLDDVGHSRVYSHRRKRVQLLAFVKLDRSLNGGALRARRIE